MADLPKKLDEARKKVKAAFAKAGVTYPTMLYRVKTTTGGHPSRGVVGTVTNTDTMLEGAFFKVPERDAALGKVGRAGGLIQEGMATLEKVSLSITREQLEAAQDPSKACVVVDDLEYRVTSFKAEPPESPLFWTLNLRKAT